MNRMSGIRTGIALGALTLVAVGCKEGAPTPLVVGQEPQNSKPPATATADVTKTFTPLPSFTPEATLTPIYITTPTEIIPAIPGLSVEPNFTFDQKAGMVVWDAKSWSTLKDSDKAQIVAWLGGQKINRIEINQTDGSRLIELPNGKSFLPVKIAPDANFEIVKDSKLNANVATINGKVFAKYDGSVWILGTKQPNASELQAEPLNQVLAAFPNLTIQPEMKGNSVILHLIKPDGKEFAYRKLGDATSTGIVTSPVYLWENMTTPEQNGVIDYIVTHYQYDNTFGPDLQRQLHDGLISWLQRFPDRLPSIDEIGLSGFVNPADYDRYLNKSALMNALLYVNKVSRIPGNVNRGGWGGEVRLADAYNGDAMIAWFLKEALVNNVIANIPNIKDANDPRIGYPENVSTTGVIIVAETMSKLGGNPGVDIGNQLDKVKGKIPYPK